MKLGDSVMVYNRPEKDWKISDISIDEKFVTCKRERAPGRFEYVMVRSEDVFEKESM